MKYRYLAALALVLGAAVLLAGAARAANDDPTLIFLMRPDTVVRDDAGRLIDTVTNELYAPPLEPGIQQVGFVKQDPPGTLQERVARLVQGITVDVPPEYDHYGYELRRYMARINTLEIHGSMGRLEEQLSNVRKARIILDYWIIELRKEVRALEKTLDEDKNADPQLRSALKYNEGLVSAFDVECREWIDSNKAILEFLKEQFGTYTYEDESLRFATRGDRHMFSMLHKRREAALEIMKRYKSFEIMIY